MSCVDLLPLDKPSPMFGEALRQQVEERLSFFETGQPPSKNADAIRKVLAQLALDDDENEDEEMADEPALPLIEPTPKKDKERKKKRKSSDDDDDMDVDEGMPVKRQKLSKEEKKALKREKKKERKEKSGIEVSLADVLDRSLFTDSNDDRERNCRRKRKRRKRRNIKVNSDIVFVCSHLSVVRVLAILYFCSYIYFDFLNPKVEGSCLGSAPPT